MRKSARLPGVEKIADEDRNRRAGQNLAEDVAVRQMNQLAAQTDDQNELDQVVDHQTEEAFEILAHEPGGIDLRLGHKFEIPVGDFPRM